MCEKLIFGLICLLGGIAFAQGFPERPELFTRIPHGTYRIHATTEADVTGKGNVDLLICQPIPESNRYHLP